MVCCQSRNSTHFTEPECSLTQTQESDTCLYPGPATNQLLYPHPTSWKHNFNIITITFHLLFIIENNTGFADKSLARPGRKQANVSVRMT